MRYLLRQNILSWGEAFTIRDESERDVFQVTRTVFAIGEQLSFSDTQGKELAFIKRIFGWNATYEIHRDGAIVAMVTHRTFSFPRHRFIVDVPGPNDLEVEGNLTNHEYEVRRGDRVVATVSKRWFSWRDTYGVDIAEGEDDVLVLVTAVLIDMVCHPEAH